MKRIALSLVSIVAALAVVAGVTTAIFSDSKSIVGNSVATGTLKLTLNKSAGKPWAVSGMKPGDVTGWEYMDIFNGPYPPQPGQLPFEAYFRLENPVGDIPLYNALEIDLFDSGWDSTCGNGDDVSVYSGLLTGVTGSSLRTQTSDNDPNSGGTPGNDDIRPGSSQRLCQRLRLPLSVGNTLQGKSVTFEEWVDAEQNND